MIDVIIPTHDNPKYLDLCVQAVERFTRNEHRVIVVNSGSTTAEARKALDAIKSRGHAVVELASNESFSKAVNAGLAVSRGEHVALLNDDAIVTDGWDAVMVGELADPSVGMVGARSPGGAAGFQGQQTEYADFLEVKTLVFTHVALRRDVLEKVGLLDAATFDGWGSEDLDYSWRVREAGYRLKVSAARTLHVGGATMVQVCGGPVGRAAEYGRMHRKLVEKYGKARVERELRMFPRIALAVPTYNGKVDNDFFQSFAMLQKAGSYELEVFQTKRLVIHWARERITEAIVNGNFDYVWWVDDDMVFPPDTLERLLRARKPVVTAIAYQRGEPYHACIFEWTPIVHRFKDDADKPKDPNDPGGQFTHLDGQEHTGLRRIDGCGSACILVETAVYKQLAERRPWYDNRQFGEDLHFCFRCRKAEIPVYCDTDLIVGHIGDPKIVDEGVVARYRAAKAQRDAAPLEVAR